MKKFLVAMGLVAFAVVGCDDSSSASAGQNDEPGVESSSSIEHGSSSSSEKVKSSSSKNEDSSSSVKSEYSSSVVTPESSSSEIVVNSSSSISEMSSRSSECLDWSLPKETYLNPEIEYDTIIDSRDGKVYRTVKIGDQTWMAENLNYDPGQGGSDDAKYDWSWCYNNDPKNCDVAGRLYTWAAAMDSAGTWSANGKGCGYGTDCSPTDAVRGICPAGWHLPTNPEWEMLFTAVGGELTAGKVLKSQTGWNNNGNGTDAYGFSALPAGRRNYYGNFDYDGYYAYFWSATEDGIYFAYYMYLGYDYECADLYYYHMFNGFSVRCLKD